MRGSETTVFAIDSANCTAAWRAAGAIGGVGQQWADTAGAARKEARWEEAEQWLGPAAEAAAHRVDAAVNQWDVAGVSAQAVGMLAGVHVGILALAQRVVQAALTTARVALMRVSGDGTVTGGWTATVPGVGAGVAGALSSTLRSALAMVTLSDAAAGHVVRALGSAGREAVDLSDLGDVGGMAGTREAGDVSFQGDAGREAVDRSPPVQRIDTDGGPVFIAGDVRSAEVVTTFVSGVGSSGDGPMATTREWARHEVAQAQAQGRNIAVVAWHGYRAPNNLAEGVGTSRAQVGARDLREFQRNLRAQNPGAKLNLVGFSYGSVVAGAAATRGVEADSLTFLGSPGVGASSAEELRLLRRGVEHEGEVRSEHVPGDLIQLTTEPTFGVHGPDPSQPGFGRTNPSQLDPSQSDSSQPDPSQPGPSQPGPSQPGFDRSRHSQAESWSSYHWQRLLDLYILARGDHDTHSSYLWDPSVEVTR